MRKHIFNAGPCKLPDSTLEAVSKACLELDNSGQSILEVSHRSPEFQAILDESVALLKEILQIPDNYSVLFLGGGASLQFAMLPLNFLNKKAAFLNTGVWSKKAIAEAKIWGDVEVVASSEENQFTYYPKDFTVPQEVDYFHLTSNNTVVGTELLQDIDSPVPLIADMSSDICSRPVDISKYFLIYGGCQKNMGPAGVTFVIIRDDYEKYLVPGRPIPIFMRYGTHVKSGSMYNTPPCSAILGVRETLRWVKASGGVAEMERRAVERSEALYAEIERNALFQSNVEKESRSRMNVVFVLAEGYPKELEKDFLDLCKENNICGVKGHSLVGGFRASIYNASTMEDVNALIATMKAFEAKHVRK